MNLVHLSDLHLRNGWFEEQGQVLAALFEDLAKTLSKDEDNWIAFSGDAVQAGDEHQQFKEFACRFDKEFNALGIPKARRMICPGNHDVMRSVLQQNIYLFSPFYLTKYEETNFNEMIRKDFYPSIIDRFKNFFQFSEDFADSRLTAEQPFGAKFDCKGVGVFLLNTALTATTGIQLHRDGVWEQFNDEGRIRADTRELAAWVQNSHFPHRVLIMHHPIDVFDPAAHAALAQYINSAIDIVLCGHVHLPDANYATRSAGNTLTCVAPPLFTRKSDPHLGYTIIKIEEDRYTVQYRQLSRTGRFVAGSYFSGTDDGSVTFEKKSPKEQHYFENFLERQFREHTYDTSVGASFWISPCLRIAPENSDDFVEESINADDLRLDEASYVVFAPAHFGLTAFGYHLALREWRERPGSFVLVVDAQETPNDERHARRFLQQMLQRAGGVGDEEIHGLVVDNFRLSDKLSSRKVKTLQTILSDAKLVFLCRFSEMGLKELDLQHCGLQQAKKLFLSSLSRGQVRELASQYLTHVNSRFHEDELVDMAVRHLEKINCFRTPANCIMLFRVCDAQTDEMLPVNRTDLLERILFIYFYRYTEPGSYSTRATLKDALFSLGYVVEMMVRSDTETLPKRKFRETIETYLENKLLEIDVDELIAFLIWAKILNERDGIITFNFTVWFYFFLAHRMDSNDQFAEWMLAERQYTRLPEVIEFFAGVNRRREDLIERIISDLSELIDSFDSRTGLSDEFEPFSTLGWQLSGQQIEALEEDIADEIQGSSLPTEVKDRFADRSYDRRAPYVQKIHSFIAGDSLARILRTSRAACLALRNSDHVNGQLKLDALRVIGRSWHRVTQVHLVCAPELAKFGEAHAEGIRFYLSRDMSRSSSDDEEYEWRLGLIFQNIPYSVYSNIGHELASARLGSVFAAALVEQRSNLSGLFIAHVLIHLRSKRWTSYIWKFASKLPRNSFIIHDMLRILQKELRYGFCDSVEKESIARIMAKLLEYHETGSKRPKKKIVEDLARKLLATEDNEAG